MMNTITSHTKSNHGYISEQEALERKKRREQIKASFRLEGIEFTGEDEAMFQIFDEKKWDADTCIKFIFEYKGYSVKNNTE
mgnify:CR=1 FL=1|jgi:hypothetical protein